MFIHHLIRGTKLAAALVIVLVASCKTAQKTTSEPKVILDEPLPHNRSLLWQVSGNGLSQPSYIFGTIHVIGVEDFAIGANVEKKLNQSKVLVLEMDVKNINPLTIASVSLLPDNKTVQDYLDPDDYMLLKSYFIDSLGTSPVVFTNAYARMKPFFLQQMLYIRFLGKNIESYELAFTRMAEDNDQAVEGLETLEQQLGFLDAIPIEQQLEGLVRSIREYGKEVENFNALIEAYKSQDLDQLSKLISEQDDMKDITNTLLDERNLDWIPKLEVYFQKGPAFVAVGAGHLGGEKGVIQLLRDKGYTVQPIAFD
jgi:uncharacterized protein YbaP (TraB family)